MKKSLTILLSFIFCISLLSVSACSKTQKEEATNQKVTEEMTDMEDMTPESEEQSIPESAITSDMGSDMEDEMYTDEE